MVFSSAPTYLDPSNWHQQQQTQQIIGNNNITSNPLYGSPVTGQPHGGGGSIRPGSMSERARLANIPMPEAALKCPRCESTNTKFCYFNNYSLSQPRHFCKTCRRYWTRGGAMRNVPVGGGCRRNKKTKSANAKSPSGSDRQNNSTSSSAAAGSTNSGVGTGNISGLSPQLPPLRFMSPPLSHLPDTNYNSEIGLNYGGITAENFPSGLLGHGGGSSAASLLSGGVIEPWRVPFYGGLEAPAAYQFHQGGESGLVVGGGESSRLVRPKISNSMISQMAAVKMEENPRMRQLMGGGNEQWMHTTAETSAAAAWTDLSSFSSSSTSNPL